MHRAEKLHGYELDRMAVALFKALSQNFCPQTDGYHPRTSVWIVEVPTGIRTVYLPNSDHNWHRLSQFLSHTTLCNVGSVALIRATSPTNLIYNNLISLT